MAAPTGQASPPRKRSSKDKGKGVATVSALAEATRRRTAAAKAGSKNVSHDSALLKRKYGRSIGARFDGNGNLIPADYMTMFKKDLDRPTESRPLKKRRSQRKEIEAETVAKEEDPVEQNSKQQTPVIQLEATNDSEEKDEDSDEEWEEVDLEMSKIDFVLGSNADEEQDNITIALDKDEFDAEAKAKRKRKSANPKLTSEERYNRQLVHRIHLATLMVHVSIRNKWCSDFQVRQFFRALIPDKIKKELHPQSAALQDGGSDINMSQMVLTRKLLDGLRHLMELWKKQFRVKGVCGLKMTSWADIYRRDRKVESKIDKAKFIKLMKKFRGSRDVGAQGFCALLRAADVDARLVCSLQPLDFTSNVATGELKIETSDEIESPPDNDQNVQSDYPIYWVEVWDAFSQRWIAIDPIVQGIVETASINRKSKLEPPLTDKNNMMRYVVAFDDDGFARDVTRRYTHYYNAKTRKKRITNTPEGAVWYENLLKHFEKKYATERDKLEDAEMEMRDQSEEIPSSVQDFRGHPL